MARVLAKRRLIPHPGFAAPGIDIGVKLTLVGSDVLKIDYVVIGAVASLLVPPLAVPDRADGLWQHSCFEAFLGSADSTRYVEYNFSPSRHFAIYRFDGYRDGMQPAYDLPIPDIYLDTDGNARLEVAAWVDLSALSHPVDVGLSAVIETKDGTKSYWALAHAPGPPDFHNRDCFTAFLAAPDPA